MAFVGENDGSWWVRDYNQPTGSWGWWVDRGQWILSGGPAVEVIAGAAPAVEAGAAGAGAVLGAAVGAGAASAGAAAIAVSPIGAAVAVAVAVIGGLVVLRGR